MRRAGRTGDGEIVIVSVSERVRIGRRSGGLEKEGTSGLMNPRGLMTETVCRRCGRLEGEGERRCRGLGLGLGLGYRLGLRRRGRRVVFRTS